MLYTYQALKREHLKELFVGFYAYWKVFVSYEELLFVIYEQ